MCQVFSAKNFAFSAFYALARLIMVALYFRAWRHVSVARALARRYVIGFSVGALLWFSAAFLPWPWVLPVWGAAMLIDLNSVLSQTARTLTAQHPPDTQHATERYGLLTIIVLGESFVKVLSAVSADGLHRTTFLMCGCVLFICCSLWWIYFDDVAGSRIKPGRLTPFFWIYSHLPLTMAITSVGVAAKKAVFFDPRERRAHEVSLVLVRHPGVRAVLGRGDRQHHRASPSGAERSHARARPASLRRSSSCCWRQPAP